MATNKSYGIKEAAVFLGIDVHTLRTLKRKGKVAAETKMVGNVPHLVFTQEALDGYKATRKSGFGSTPREDGRAHRHVLIPKDKLAEFDKWVAANGGITYKPAKKAPKA